MQLTIHTLGGVTLVLVLGELVGCGSGTRHDFEIVAPAFDAPRVRFTNYGYSPVGAFAATRGHLVPFVDTDGDSNFDPQHEASGRCDQRSRTCWLDQARLRLVMTTTDCDASTGTWLFGNVYDREGRRVDATLCDDQGTCSQEHRDVFQGLASVDAIWIPDAKETPRSPARALMLRAGEEEFRFDDVSLPGPIRLVDVQTEQQGDLHVSVTADQSIDMASLWVMRGDALQWSNVARPGSFQATGTALEATVPQAVLDSCGDACEVYLQFAHVWRDDHVFSLSEIKHKVRQVSP